MRQTIEDIEQAAQQRVLQYDRAGDGHYDTVSAFIKSLRGNDPDAALYWLATMVAAGEDPRFIMRRLIISASEDVGNADPHALQVATSAAYALDFVGLPEAQFALAQATAYIAAAPKSNRAGSAYWAAMDDVLRHGSLPVPNHLRSATWREAKRLRHRQGLRLPARLTRARTWSSSTCPIDSRTGATTSPSDHGYEKVIGERMDARRRAREASRGRRPGARPDGAPEVGRNEGRRQRHGAARGQEKRATAARQKREAQATGCAV